MSRVCISVHEQTTDGTFPVGRPMKVSRVDFLVDLAYGGAIFVAIALIVVVGTDVGIAFGLGVLVSYLIHIGWKMARFDPDWMTTEVAEQVESTVSEEIEKTVGDTVSSEVGEVAERVEKTVSEEVTEELEKTVSKQVGEEVGEVIEKIDEMNEGATRRDEEATLEEESADKGS